jgi:hypothetical protein
MRQLTRVLLSVVVLVAGMVHAQPATPRNPATFKPVANQICFTFCDGFSCDHYKCLPISMTWLSAQFCSFGEAMAFAATKIGSGVDNTPMITATRDSTPRWLVFYREMSESPFQPAGIEYAVYPDLSTATMAHNAITDTNKGLTSAANGEYIVWLWVAPAPCR